MEHIRQQQLAIWLNLAHLHDSDINLCAIFQLNEKKKEKEKIMKICIKCMHFEWD